MVLELVNENLLEIQEILKEHEERISTLENLINKGEVESIKKQSLREFLIEKKPNNDVNKTLCICYYLEVFEKMTPINKDDIEEGFRRSKEKVPKNINYKVYRNIQNGYLMEEKNKKNNLKAWSLTNSGIEFVNNSFKPK